MTKLQYINDNVGKPQFVVLPIAEYESLISEHYEDIPYIADSDDDETIPNDVVQLMARNDVSLLAAWRIYRDLSQYEVSEKLGTSQSAVSQLETASVRPQKRTREKLAIIYNCRPTQLTL